MNELSTLGKLLAEAAEYVEIPDESVGPEEVLADLIECRKKNHPDAGPRHEDRERNVLLSKLNPLIDKFKEYLQSPEGKRKSVQLLNTSNSDIQLVLENDHLKGELAEVTKDRDKLKVEIADRYSKINETILEKSLVDADLIRAQYSQAQPSKMPQAIASAVLFLVGMVTNLGVISKGLAELSPNSASDIRSFLFCCSLVLFISVIRQIVFVREFTYLSNRVAMGPFMDSFAKEAPGVRFRFYGGTVPWRFTEAELTSFIRTTYFSYSPRLQATNKLHIHRSLKLTFQYLLKNKRYFYRRIIGLDPDIVSRDLSKVCIGFLLANHYVLIVPSVQFTHQFEVPASNGP